MAETMLDTKQTRKVCRSLPEREMQIGGRNRFFRWPEFLSFVRRAGSLHKSLERNQWLLADQVLVSGMNFTTTVLLARMLGVYNFGIYTVLYYILLYVNSIQLALNIQPMLSIAPQIPDGRESRLFLRGMAGYQYALSALFCLLIALAALLEKLNLLPHRMDAAAIFPFILAVYAYQMQDWFRRLCYLKDLGQRVFWNDVVSYVGQIAGFLLLWRIGRMNVSSAYYAVALTSLLAFGIGLLLDDMRSTLSEVRAAMTRTWKMGRSLLVTAQLQWLGSGGVNLLIAGVVGVRASSGFRAVITMVGPVIVLSQFLDNVIPVRAARAYAFGGEQSLVRYLRKVGLILAATVGVPLVLACIFARPILVLVFGHAYAEFAGLVVWEVAFIALSLLYRGTQYYHRTKDTTAVLAQTALLASLTSLGGCLLLVKPFGAAGALAALDLGQAVNVWIPLQAAIKEHRKAPLESGSASL